MEQINAIETIAGVIQLAVAPVFLLAGIAGLLNVLAQRLSRVVDRARVVERSLAREIHSDHQAILQKETEGLWKRIRLVNWSIRLFVSGALVVCLVIVALFLGELTAVDLSVSIAVLFVGAMCLLIGGLIMFLFEVSISTSTMRIGLHDILNEDEPEHSSPAAVPPASTENKG